MIDIWIISTFLAFVHVVQTNVSISLGHILRSGIAGSYGNSVLRDVCCRCVYTCVCEGMCACHGTCVEVSGLPELLVLGFALFETRPLVVTPGYMDCKLLGILLSPPPSFLWEDRNYRFMLHCVWLLCGSW